jgi:uncharacterized membrane protein YqiK
MQTSLTNARVKAQIAESEGEADLQRAKKQAEKQVVMAEAQLAQSRRQAEQTVVLAEADSQQAILAGRGEAQRLMQVGLSEAAVLMQKVASYGDPRLFALSHIGSELAHSTQPLVPERVFLAGGLGGDGVSSRNVGDGANGNGHVDLGGGATAGLVGLLLQSLLAERTCFANGDSPEMASLKELTNRLTRETLANMRCAGGAPPLSSKVAAAGKEIAAVN